MGFKNKKDASRNSFLACMKCSLSRRCFDLSLLVESVCFGNDVSRHLSSVGRSMRSIAELTLSSHFTSSQLLASFNGPNNCCNADLNVFVCRCPGTNADSHRYLPPPLRRAAPAGTLFLDGSHAFRCLGITAERNEHLVENHIVQNSVPSCSKLLCKLCRLLTTAFDHLGDATSPERLDCSPNFDPAGPVRHIRIPLYGFAPLPYLKVGGLYGHRAAKTFRTSYKSKPAIVGHIEPLVAVERPRVCISEARR